MKNTNEDLELFLKESNAIEGVYDDVSLAQARYAWKYLSRQKALTPGVILKTHKTLMLHQPLFPDEKGYFRQVDVQVGGKKCLDWEQVPRAVDLWCLAQVWAPIKGIEDAIAMHVRYENIHPFVDGNGRTGRLFLNWTMQSIGLPLIVYTEKNKHEYYKLFH